MQRRSEEVVGTAREAAVGGCGDETGAAARAGAGRSEALASGRNGNLFLGDTFHLTSTTDGPY